MRVNLLVGALLGRRARGGSIAVAGLVVAALAVAAGLYSWVGGAGARWIPGSPVYEALRIEGARLTVAGGAVRVVLYITNAGNVPVDITEVEIIDSMSGYVLCGKVDVRARIVPHGTGRVEVALPRGLCGLRSGGVYVVKVRASDGVEAAYVVQV